LVFEFLGHPSQQTHQPIRDVGRRRIDVIEPPHDMYIDGDFAPKTAVAAILCVATVIGFLLLFRELCSFPFASGATVVVAMVMVDVFLDHIADTFFVLRIIQMRQRCQGKIFLFAGPTAKGQDVTRCGFVAHQHIVLFGSRIRSFALGHVQQPILFSWSSDTASPTFRGQQSIAGILQYLRTRQNI
jgi:hypothetical protein